MVTAFEIPVSDIGVSPVYYKDLYLDDFLVSLNAQYPIDSVIGGFKEGMARGDWVALGHYTSDSPMKNSEGEHPLNAILYMSANAGMWQPWIVKTPPKDAQNLDTPEKYINAARAKPMNYDIGKIDAGALYGLMRAEKAGFVHLSEHAKNVVVLPTQNLMDYFVQRK